jgi:hypothetical protein
MNPNSPESWKRFKKIPKQKRKRQTFVPNKDVMETVHNMPIMNTKNVLEFLEFAFPSDLDE